MSVIIPIVERHLEEATFLWPMRDRAVWAPHYTLKQLADLDDRLDGHLEGLAVAGDAGWDLARRTLEDAPEPGSAFTSAVLAFASGDPARIGAVLAASAAPPLARAVTSALGWLPWSPSEAQIPPLLAADSPIHRRIGLAASALHRRPLSQPMTNALVDPDGPLRARAPRAIGELGLAGQVQTLRDSFLADDPSCQFWAAWSSALLSGDKAASLSLQGVAEAGGPHQEDAARMVVRRLDLSYAKAWLRTISDKAGLRRQGLRT